MNGRNDSDIKLFEGRVFDLVRSSEYEIKTSRFLTPSEQKSALDAARSGGAAERCLFWGGAPGCERRLAVFVPEWLAPDVTPGGAFDPAREDTVKEMISEGTADDAARSVVPVTVSGSAYSELTHRDYLGALISLGIERDSIGDIVVTGPSSAVVFALPGAAKLIENELTSVGREKVSVKAGSLPDGFRVEKEYEAITDTVMSPRLDGIVKALCGVSRETASELVSSGDVSVNYSVSLKPDAEVVKGDILSVRGYGKFIYDGDRGVNRRGRLRIDARKYI